MSVRQSARTASTGNYLWGRRCATGGRAVNFAVPSALTCFNGTGALGLVLMALGLDTKHAVLYPSAFAATAETIAWFGATPVFVDIMSGPSISISKPRAGQVGQGSGRLGQCDLRPPLQPADYERIDRCAAHRLYSC
jgi:hypothetical protein